MAKNINELDVICHVGKNTTKTLATSAEFVAQTQDGDFPFRESNLSRLDMSLITKIDGKTDVLVWNIPAKEINELKLKTDIAVEKLMTAGSAIEENVTSGTEGFASSSAFRVSLMLNGFKGRTPGDVLAADPSKKDDLLKGKEYLKANLAKYPKNQEQIDAIDEAVKLLEIGEINTATAVTKPLSNGVLTIYKREYKYKNKKDDNGNNLVYSITITCDPSKNMPFEVNVMNCFAPVVTGGSGQTIVKTANAINTRRASISMSDSEWIGLVGQAYDLYENFKTIHAVGAFKRVAENAYSQQK